MKHLRRKKTLTQHIVAYSYTCSTMLVLLLIAATLQSGSANTYLFVHNDLIYDLNRILFVVGFPVSYVIALFFCYQIIRIPRFDSNYRLLVINLATYSVFGLSLSIFRIPLFSRTVFITEFNSIYTLSFHSTHLIPLIHDHIPRYATERQVIVHEWGEIQGFVEMRSKPDSTPIILTSFSHHPSFSPPLSYVNFMFNLYSCEFGDRRVIRT